MTVTVIAVTAMKVTAMMASFLQVAVAVFEEHLARKLRFHIFNMQLSKDVLHESFVFTSSTCSF